MRSVDQTKVRDLGKRPTLIPWPEGEPLNVQESNQTNIGVLVLSILVFNFVYNAWV